MNKKEKQIQNRMREISASPGMQDVIIANIKEHGLYDGGPCPCMLCFGKLHPKKLSFINTDEEPWTKVEIDVFLCGTCGFQGRVTKEE